MRLLTWNIQCGKGCDGVTDLARIVAIARETMDADVFCFQEVSSNFAKHDGGGDQSAELAALLPGYLPIFRPAIETVDQAGQLHRFGNMTLSRLPVVQINNHILPWPGAGSVRSMRRHALEVTVQASFGADTYRQHASRISFGRAARGADHASARLAGGRVNRSEGAHQTARRAL